MKLSKLRVSTSVRHLVGKDIPRQNRTSVGMQKALKKAGHTSFAGESGEVDGAPAKMHLARARRCGGMVRRAEGGSVLSEDSKREAARLRQDDPGGMSVNELAKDAGVTAVGSMIHGLSRRLPGRMLGRAFQGAGIAGGIIDGGVGAKRTLDNAQEARRITRGQAEPGKEDRASGGRVNKGPLDAERRNALPSKDFALAGRRYPINDPNHARNALSRVSQNGSPAEKAEVRNKVHRKYPNIGKGD